MQTLFARMAAPAAASSYRCSSPACTSLLTFRPGSVIQTRLLSFSEKQKLKYLRPPPLEATPAEYEKQRAIVVELQKQSAAITAEITPMQVREADLRKREYELWQEIRAIKRHLMEQTPQLKRRYLRWELARRKQLAEDERAGKRRKHTMQYLCW